MTDESEVARVLYRYALGVDTRDWVLYRSVFADTLSADFSGFDPDLPPMRIKADQWVAGIKPVFTGLAASHHAMTNPLPAIDGDDATITMYVRAHHVLDPDDPRAFYTVGGYYQNSLVKTDGSWLLSEIKLTVTWRAGDPGVMARARIRGGAKAE